MKECAYDLSQPLSLIFQQSFDTGTLPADWRTASIVPIFKIGNRTDKTNYRPVSLTSVPCKIMESLIKGKLMNFLESNDLLSAGHNMDSAVEDHVSLTSSKLWKTGQKHWMKDMDWM